MNDVLLLYLFTRLDAVHGVAICSIVVGIVLLLGMLFIGPIYVVDYVEPGDEKRTREALRFWRRAVTAMLCASVVALVALPSSKDLAIILGGKVAIDAIRSPEAKEVGGLVLDVVREKLKEAAK